MGRLELKQILSGHRGRVWNVCWHPRGNWIASCGEDKTIRIWSGNGKEEQQQRQENIKWSTKMILTEGHTRTIREVAWSPCGKYLASASFDATTAIWEKNSSNQFECCITLEGHENEVKSVAWSNNGSTLATCSRDKSVWIWESNDDEYECAALINSHTQDVKKVRWHPHEDTLASASYDDTAKIFKEDGGDGDWSCVATLASHSSTVWSLSFDATGNRLVTCSDDATLKIWKEYKQGNNAGIAVSPNGQSVWKCVCTLSGYHTRTIYDVDWCKLTGLIVTACGDDIIRIFRENCDDSNPDAPNFDLICSVDTAHSQDVNCTQWNPVVPGQLASASDDATVKIWFYND